MNTETIIKQLKEAQGSIIDLGCANGWNKETNEQYRALRELMVPGSQGSKNLGRCWTEYSFDVNVEGKIYTIIHNVDSGD